MLLKHPFGCFFYIKKREYEVIIISNIQKNINKITRALRVKGIMPLINQSQFYGEYGPITKYVVHYGQLYDKKDKDGSVLIANNIIGETCSKIELLKILVTVLKEGDTYG